MESLQTAGEPAPAPYTGPAVSELISRVAACVVELARAIHDLERLIELPDEELARLAAGIPDTDPEPDAGRGSGRGGTGCGSAGSGAGTAPADCADATEFALFAEASNLTRREAEVLRHLLYGHSNRRISRSLLISESTVKNHLHAIFVKLNASDRTQVITKAYRFMAEHTAADRARQTPPHALDPSGGSDRGRPGRDSRDGAV